MKINFVANSFDGSWMYRCYNPANNSKNDCKLDIDPLTETRTPRTDILDTDVVIFHRAKDEDRLEMVKMLKNRGIIVGYDNDDTWNFCDGHPAFNKGLIPLDQHKATLKEVDFITASTDFLTNEYKEFNNNVYTIPNLIDFDKYPSPVKANNKKKRILITGSVLWCKDGINFVNTLKRLSKKYQLVIFGNSHRLKGLDAEYHPYINPMYYPQKLKDLNIDLCIIPREENYFNKCKSACKYLEMAASKIPVVAQSFSTKDSPYDLVAKEKAPIVLATYDWEEKIEQALEKAEDGYDWVYKNYNAKDNKFDKIVNQFQGLK